MNKVIAGIVIVIILIAGGWAIHNHKNTSSNSMGDTNTAGSSQNTQSNSSSSQNAQLSSQGKVSIQNMMFTPSQVTIAKGGTVTWTNNDSTAHTVTSDDGTSFDSGTVDPGQTFSHTFNSAGSFQYHCTIHPSMRGTVVVQ